MNNYLRIYGQFSQPQLTYIDGCKLKNDNEPVCLGVLRELNARLSNRKNQDMFGWAKFVGLRF